MLNSSINSILDNNINSIITLFINTVVGGLVYSIISYITRTSEAMYILNGIKTRFNNKSLDSGIHSSDGN